MEYRDRDQGTAFLYNRLGWEVRDRGAEPERKLSLLPAEDVPPLDAAMVPEAEIKAPKLGDV